MTLVIYREKRMHMIKLESHQCEGSSSDDDTPTQCQRIGTSVFDTMEKHFDILHKVMFAAVRTAQKGSI